MGSVVDINTPEFSGVISSATNLILTRPLDEFHIALIQQVFEKYYALNFWQGFAVLDQVPEFLQRNVMSSRGERKLGAVLFSNNQDQAHFVFLDLQENFRLINTSGHTILMEDHMDSLLDEFHKKIQH